ncbi:MAG: hypothetical protein GY821_04205, partial [Gammaproteobacteria bacterium]|nr:hypothetical protein [Gammaproteobacteria bacterium]
MPTRWDQPMEVEQLPEKPPSPPATPPRRTPEFKVPQHTAPRRVASGSGFAGWGPGRSVIAGEGWKPVRPTRSLIYGTEMQTNLRVRENRKMKMKEAKDVNLKLWGRNPAGLDGDLRQQVTNALVDVVDRRGQFHLPFLPVFQGEYHHSVKESMATPPLQKRM